MSFPRTGRTAYWLANLALYALLNMFQLRMRAGMWFQWQSPYATDTLTDQLLGPLNIFSFPGQIIVLALVMALLCAIPIIIAQFINLMHAIPFILIVVFMGHNRILALCLFVSCAAVSFEPLRFKSKFVAAVLCLLPVVLYWWLFAGEDPSLPQGNVLRWALLYAPWALAFLNCVVLFGVVITIGHFFRYRSGVLMPIFGLGLFVIVLLFHVTVGMTERDFQALVYRHVPRRNPNFQTKAITALLEKELAERLEREPYLSRQGTLDTLRMEWRLAYRFGPSAAGSSTSLAARNVIEFYLHKLHSIEEIDRFIKLHPNHPRVADALYCKALLIDLNVDQRALRDDDTLRYYHHLPSTDSELVWRLLLQRFPDAPVSIEARRRIARLDAAYLPEAPANSFKFDDAIDLLDDAQQRCRVLLAWRRQNPPPSRWWSDLFSPPEPTITDEHLQGLHLRIGRLTSLIGRANRTGHLRHEKRLARFVGLDPHQLDYSQQLKALLFDSPQPDPLIDNIRLAQVLLERDPDRKMILLTNLTQQYPDTDGGLEAHLKLALILLEQRRRSEHLSDRQSLLSASRKHLQAIVDRQPPDDFWSQQANELLQKNPVQ